MTEDASEVSAIAKKADKIADNQRLINLWEMHSSRPWTVPKERHATNVVLINAFVSQTVHLTKAVLALHSQGMDFQAVPLIRMTLECAATASWLALYPEKTPDHLRASSQQRKKLLEGIVKTGLSGEPGLSENAATLEFLAPYNDGEGKDFKQRCDALAGGEQLYLMYRALSAHSHPGGSLADQYVRLAEQTETNPWGVTLLIEPLFDNGVQMLEVNAALLLRAQIAADSILLKPRHNTQLTKMAKKLGVSTANEPAS